MPLAKAAEEGLALLGLERDSRDVLSHLISLGSCRAGEVARTAGCSRATAYTVLRKLVEEGLVRERAGRPLLYEAVDLSEVFRRHALVSAEQGLRLAELANVVPAQLQLPPPKVARPEHVSLYSGRRTVYREMHRMLHGAPDVVRLCGNSMFGRRVLASEDLLLALEQAHRRGIDTAVLVPRSEAAEGLMDRLGKDLVCAYPPDNVRIVAWCVTGSEMLTILAQPDDIHPLHGDDLGIKVESQVLARNAIKRLSKLRDLARKTSAE